MCGQRPASFNWDLAPFSLREGTELPRRLEQVGPTPRVQMPYLGSDGQGTVMINTHEAHQMTAILAEEAPKIVGHVKGILETDDQGHWVPDHIFKITLGTSHITHAEGGLILHTHRPRTDSVATRISADKDRRSRPMVDPHLDTVHRGTERRAP